MCEWVKLQLECHKTLNANEKRAWWGTLQWYFGFCAKHQLEDPRNREHGKCFWREIVKNHQPEPWQKEQWGAAMKWFFNELVAADDAGTLMRSKIRQRHLAYATEKNYMSWLRRFQVFLQVCFASVLGLLVIHLFSVTHFN